MRCASPSTTAVFPTPGSPMSTGLFLRRRASTWIVRRISSSRPITGSSFPARASSVRLVLYFLSESPLGVASGLTQADPPPLLLPPLPLPLPPLEELATLSVLRSRAAAEPCEPIAIQREDVRSAPVVEWSSSEGGTRCSDGSREAPARTIGFARRVHISVLGLSPEFTRCSSWCSTSGGEIHNTSPGLLSRTRFHEDIRTTVTAAGVRGAAIRIKK